MKTKKLIISGFVSYALLEILGMLFALFSGRLHALPYEFTWRKFFSLLIVFSISVGFMGMIIGYLFGKLQKLIPIENIFIKSIIFHMIVLILMSFYKGTSYLVSIDFIFSVLTTVFIGWFFIWFYNFISNEGVPIKMVDEKNE